MELSECVENYTWKMIVGVKILAEFIYERDKLKVNLPVRKIGMEMKNPPMAHTLDTELF